MWLIISNYYLENIPESISEHLFFKNFLGGMPPDPPSCSMLRMFSCVLCTYFRVAYIPLKAAELGHSTQNYLPPPLIRTLNHQNIYVVHTFEALSH